MSQQVNLSKSAWEAKKKTTNYQMTPQYNYKTKHYTDRYGKWYDKPPKIIYGGYNRPIRKYRQNYDAWSDTRDSWMKP